MCVHKFLNGSKCAQGKLSRSASLSDSVLGIGYNFPELLILSSLLVLNFSMRLTSFINVSLFEAPFPHSPSRVFFASRLAWHSIFLTKSQFTRYFCAYLYAEQIFTFTDDKTLSIRVVSLVIHRINLCVCVCVWKELCTTKINDQFHN